MALNITLPFLNVFKMYGFSHKTPYKSKIYSKLYFHEGQAPVQKICDVSLSDNVNSTFEIHSASF